MSGTRVRGLEDTFLKLAGRVTENSVREELGKYYEPNSINRLIVGLFARGMIFKSEN